MNSRQITTGPGAVIFCCMVALLLACTAKPTAATDNVQEARYVAKAGETAVYRFCDSGRIVYVSDGYKSGGIAVSDVSCDLMDR